MNFIMKLILITNIYLSIFAASKKEYPKIPRNDSTDFANFNDIIAKAMSVKQSTIPQDQSAAHKSPIPSVQSCEFFTPQGSPTHPTPASSKPSTKPANATKAKLPEWDYLNEDFDCVVVHTDQGPVKKYFPKKTFKK